MTTKARDRAGSSRLSLRSVIAGGVAVNLGANVLLYLGHLLIARGLSRTDYATFTVTVSFVSLFALFADLGLTLLFVRKFAEAHEAKQRGERERRGELLGSIMVLRIALALLVCAVVWFVAPLLGYPSSTTHLMHIMLLTLFVSSRLMVVRSVGEAFLRGHNQYHFVALFSLIDAAVFAVALYVLGRSALELDTAVWVYSLCHLPGFILLVVMLARHAREFGVRLSTKFDLVVGMIKEGIPLVAATAFLTVHNFADALLLDRLSTPQEVSAFGAGLRVLTAVIFLPSVFSAVIGPHVTRAAVRNEHQSMHRLVTRAITVLVLGSMAMALVLTSASTTVVSALFGGSKYADAASIVVVFGWSIIPIAIATFLSEIAVAEGKLWVPAVYTGTIMILSVSLDFVLIPAFGALGAAYAKCIAVTLGTVILVVLSKGLGVVSFSDLQRQLVRSVIAMAITLTAMYVFGYVYPLPELIVAAITIVVFIGCLRLLGILPTDELRDILRLRPRT